MPMLGTQGYSRPDVPPLPESFYRFVSREVGSCNSTPTLRCDYLAILARLGAAHGARAADRTAAF